MILGHICFANMKENVFLFIPNLIGKYFEDLKFSQKCTVICCCGNRVAYEKSGKITIS